MDNQYTFQEKMTWLIEDRDPTINELAEHIGVSRQQILRWRNGENEMGITKLKALCEFYGVSADSLLGLPKGLEWIKR